MTLRRRHSLVVYRSSELAEEQLAGARAALEDLATAAEFAVLTHDGRRVADALASEARLRQADEIVLADPGACGPSRRDRRRLDSVLV